MLSRLVRWNGQSYGWRAVSGGFAAMPDTVHFTLFLSAEALLATSPGPGMLYVLARTISQSQRCSGTRIPRARKPELAPSHSAHATQVRRDARRRHPRTWRALGED